MSNNILNNNPNGAKISAHILGRGVKTLARNIGKRAMKQFGDFTLKKVVDSLLLKTAPIWGTVLFLVLVGVIIMSLFTPNAKESKVNEYATVAQGLGIPFKELIAFDMVLYDNEDLDERNPNDSAYYFIEVVYEEYTPAHTKCVRYEKENCVQEENVPEKVTKRVHYRGKETISFFNKMGVPTDDIATAIQEINQMENKRASIIVLSADEAMTATNFTDEQREHFYEILESGMIEEAFPNSEFTLAGTCVGNVSPNGKAKVNSTVEAYTPIIQKYAEQYGVGQYVEVIKALMMAESGGSGNDPMQASESGAADMFSSCRGKKGADRIGCITNPEDSIHAGVKNFASVLKIADFNIAVALQTYNFGPYFATWIKEHGGIYTVPLAEEYSRTVMAAAGQGLGTPTHAQKILSKYYADTGCQSTTITPEMVELNGYVWVTKSTRITSGFGPRPKPCPTCSAFHAAVDIGAVNPGVAGDPVWSMADGVVTYVGWISGGGNSVYIQHANGVATRYIHLQEYIVKQGQRVTAGQIIGYMGNTGGSSTGVHLDFQITVNGTPVDPLPFFRNINLVYGF